MEISCHCVTNRRTGEQGTDTDVGVWQAAGRGELSAGGAAGGEVAARLGVCVTVRSGGEECRGVSLAGCCGATRIDEVVVCARTGLSLADGKVLVRCGARLVSEGETLAELASAEGAADLVLCGEGERGGMPIGCFGFGDQGNRELREQVRRLEEELVQMRQGVSVQLGTISHEAPQHAAPVRQTAESSSIYMLVCACMRARAGGCAGELGGRDARDDGWDVTRLRARVAQRVAGLAKALRDLDGQVRRGTASCCLVEESRLGFVGEA